MSIQEQVWAIYITLPQESKNLVCDFINALRNGEDTSRFYDEDYIKERTAA